MFSGASFGDANSCSEEWELKCKMNDDVLSSFVVDCKPALLATLHGLLVDDDELFEVVPFFFEFLVFAL